MKHLFLSLFTLFVLQLIPSLKMNAQSLLDKSKWDLVFNEDFNYSSNSDPAFTNRWQFIFPWTPPPCGVNLFGNDNEVEYYNFEPSVNVVLDGSGILKLVAHTIDSQEVTCTTSSGPITRYLTYSSGMIYSKNLTLDSGECSLSAGVKYGMIEGRLKIPDDIGDFPALWLWGSHGIQIVEGDGQFMFDQGPDNGCFQHFKKVTTPDLTSEFHTYSCVWTPDKLTFFFDGQETFTESLTDFSSPFCVSQIICNLAVNNWANWWETSTMEVDYIKVYKPKSSNKDWVYRQMNGRSLDESKHIASNSPINITESKMQINNDREIFYKGTDNKLYRYFLKNTGVWDTKELGPQNDIGSDITYTNNRVYYRSNLNLLKYFSRSGLIWTNYSTQIANCGGSIVSDNSGNVFYKSTDNTIWKYDPTSASVSQVTYTPHVSGGLVVTPDGNTIYYCGTNNNLWMSSSPGTLVQLTTNGLVTKEIIYASESDKIMYIGTDHKIYQYYYDLTQATYITIPLNWYNDNAYSYLTLDPSQNIVYYVDNYKKLWYEFNDFGWASGPNGDKTNWYYTPQSYNTTNVTGPILIKSNGELYYRRRNSVLEFCPLINGENLLSINDPDGCSNTWETTYPVYKNDTTNDLAETDHLIYPIPTYDYLHIQMDMENIPEVKILNQLGQVVGEFKNDNTNDMQINISHLAPGIYYCSIYTLGGKQILKKVLKR